MELLAKLVISTVVIAGAFSALRWTWTSHLDIPATVTKYFSKKSALAEVVVTRDPKKIYQNGAAVADITGPVQVVNGKVVLAQLVNVNGLDFVKPIEYLRLKLKITAVAYSAMMTVDTQRGVLHNVYEGVACEEIKD